MTLDPDTSALSKPFKDHKHKSHLLLVKRKKFLMTTDMLKQGGGRDRKEPLNNLMNRAKCAFLASLSLCYKPTFSDPSL